GARGGRRVLDHGRARDAPAGRELLIMLEAALLHLVKGIVDHPEDVRVDARSTPRGEVLEVRVHPVDLGRVIGRSGRTAKALRTVIAALADGDPIRVDVVDVDR